MRCKRDKEQSAYTDWPGWLKCCFMSMIYRQPIGLGGMGAQDVHLDFHTAPELWLTDP